MMKVLFSPDVREYFQDLTEILFEKEYFGKEENAVKYVRSLFFEISHTLHISLKKAAPQYFDRYGQGMFYAVFKKNKNTSWYVFFSIYEDAGEFIYFVRYISNNHIIARYLENG